eukprot:5574958-Prymnesium_polylepis.2
MVTARHVHVHELKTRGARPQTVPSPERSVLRVPVRKEAKHTEYSGRAAMLATLYTKAGTRLYP